MGEESKTTPLRLGVLLSGGGSLLQSIMDECNDGSLKDVAEVAVVLSDNNAGLDRARTAGIPAYRFNPEAHSALGFNILLKDYLMMGEVDLIIVTGFKRKIEPPLLNRIPAMAHHLSLAPRLDMAKAIKLAVSSGVDETNLAIHFVDAGIGTGPIILQDKIPIVAGDSVEILQSKVRTAESRLYIEAIKLFAEDKLSAIAMNVQILD